MCRLSPNTTGQSGAAPGQSRRRAGPGGWVRCRLPGGPGPKGRRGRRRAAANVRGLRLGGGRAGGGGVGWAHGEQAPLGIGGGLPLKLAQPARTGGPGGFGGVRCMRSRRARGLGCDRWFAKTGGLRAPRSRGHAGCPGGRGTGRAHRRPANPFLSPGHRRRRTNRFKHPWGRSLLGSIEMQNLRRSGSRSFIGRQPRPATTARKTGTPKKPLTSAGGTGGQLTPVEIRGLGQLDGEVEVVQRLTRKAKR